MCIIYIYIYIYIYLLYTDAKLVIRSLRESVIVI